MELTKCSPAEINLDSDAFLNTSTFSKEQLALLHRKALSLIRQKQFVKHAKTARNNTKAR